MTDSDSITVEPSELRCAQCSTVLREGEDRETTEEGVFCRPCFNNLTVQLRQAIEAQGTEINYSMAVVGGLLGAGIGIGAWWGFTVVTNIVFGLVAVVIGFTVGKGVIILSGDKRSQGLQILSVAIAALSFFYATFLVNRTFILRDYAERGEEVDIPLLPSPELFFEVVRLGFRIMDLVFLAIVVYQAWKIPAPLKISLGDA